MFGNPVYRRHDANAPAVKDGLTPEAQLSAVCAEYEQSRIHRARARSRIAGVC
jgi:hypothetical protein